MSTKKPYTVTQSEFHGGRVVSQHSTPSAALRAAVKAAGSCWGHANGYRARTPATCCCGGPCISKDGQQLVICWDNGVLVGLEDA